MNSKSTEASLNGLEALIGTGEPYNKAFVGNQQHVLETHARFQRGEISSLEPSLAFGRR